MTHELNNRELMSLRRVAVVAVKKIFSLAEDEQKSFLKIAKDDPVKSKFRFERIIHDIRKEEIKLKEVHKILEEIEENMIRQMHKVKDRANESHKLGSVQQDIDYEISLFSRFLRSESQNVLKERKEMKELKKVA